MRRHPPPPTRYAPGRPAQPSSQPRPVAIHLPPPTRYGAAAGPSATVQAMNERPQRVRKMPQEEIYKLFWSLAETWKTQIVAGTKSSTISLNSGGGHACSALGTWDSSSQDTIGGQFSSDHMHAEMDVLDKIYQEATASELLKLEIETQPCPRCAVILNRLGIGNKVTYKKEGGFKDYPTWRPPDLWLGETGTAELLGVPANVDDDAKKTILKLFGSQKWW